jgi:hypothetical protein
VILSVTVNAYILYGYISISNGNTYKIIDYVALNHGLLCQRFGKFKELYELQKDLGKLWGGLR